MALGSVSIIPYTRADVEKMLKRATVKESWYLPAFLAHSGNTELPSPFRKRWTMLSWVA